MGTEHESGIAGRIGPSEDAAHATALALEFRTAATALMALAFLTDRNRVEIAQPYREGRPFEIAVHHCSPAQLETAMAGYLVTDSNVNEDGIRTWVELSVDGCEVTLFRR